MADFSIQRGVSTMADATATVTITAGSEYTAPSAVSKAFIRITSTLHMSKADVTNGADEWAEHETVRISHPGGDLTDDVRFTRNSTTGGCQVNWEIIEYTGSASGANEFIVRGTGEISTAVTAATGDSAAISGIATVADCVPFLTTQASTTATDVWESRHMYTLDMINDGDDKVRATRAEVTGSTAYCSYACVEFTGSNWTIQEVDHTFSSAGSEETEAISTVGSLTRAFLETQLRYATDNGGDRYSGHETYFNSVTELGMIIDTGATAADMSLKIYVVGNSQTDGTPMDVQHVSGSQTTGGGEPETIGETITEVSSLAITSIQGECARGGNGAGRRGAHWWLIRPTTTTNVELKRVETEYASTYRFDVVEWPTISAGGGSASITAKVHFYRQQQGVG